MVRENEGVEWSKVKSIVYHEILMHFRSFSSAVGKKALAGVLFRLFVNLLVGAAISIATLSASKLSMTTRYAWFWMLVFLFMLISAFKQHSELRAEQNDDSFLASRGVNKKSRAVALATSALIRFTPFLLAILAGSAVSLAFYNGFPSLLCSIPLGLFLALTAVFAAGFLRAGLALFCTPELARFIALALDAGSIVLANVLMRLFGQIQADIHPLFLLLPGAGLATFDASIATELATSYASSPAMLLPVRVVAFLYPLVALLAYLRIQKRVFTSGVRRSSRIKRQQAKNYQSIAPILMKRDKAFLDSLALRLGAVIILPIAATLLKDPRLFSDNPARIIAIALISLIAGAATLIGAGLYSQNPKASWLFIVAPGNAQALVKREYLYAFMVRFLCSIGVATLIVIGFFFRELGPFASATIVLALFVYPLLSFRPIRNIPPFTRSFKERATEPNGVFLLPLAASLIHSMLLERILGH